MSNIRIRASVNDPPRRVKPLSSLVGRDAAVAMPKPKGWRRPLKTAIVVFDEEGDELAGLEVELKTSVGMEFYYDMLMRAFTPADDESDSEPEQIAEAVRDVARRTSERLRQAEQDTRDFAAETLLSWNLLDDEGKSVPATPDEFVRRLSSPEAARVFAYWLRAMRTVPAPLVQGSESGPPSKEPPE